MKQTLFYLLVIVFLSSCANYHSRIHFSKEAQQQKKEILATAPQHTEQADTRVHHSIKEEKAKITQAQEEEKTENEQVRPEEKFISDRGEDTYLDDNYSENQEEALEPTQEIKKGSAIPQKDTYLGWSIAGLLLIFLSIIPFLIPSLTLQWLGVICFLIGSIISISILTKTKGMSPAPLSRKLSMIIVITLAVIAALAIALLILFIIRLSSNGF